MQDRYVGDVGDFGKYGLLRFFCGRELRLGIQWYLVPDEVETNDGRHVSYLRKPVEYRDCDAPLFDVLKKIYDSGDRHISAIEKAGIFESNVIYYGARLDTDSLRPDAREQSRGKWEEKGANLLSEADIVFFDPDNGLEPKTTQRRHKKGKKFVYSSELQKYFSRGQSLVVYHHIGRKGGSADEQIHTRLRDFKKRFTSASFAWHFRRGSARAFFVVPSDKAKQLIIERRDSFSRSTWVQRGHFHLVT